VPWDVLDGPHHVDATEPSTVVRGWRISRGNDPPREVTVFIAHDVMTSNDPVALPEPVMEARISEGESAVASILELDDPPSEIRVTPSGLQYGPAI
jgi:hypothetical protein